MKMNTAKGIDYVFKCINVGNEKEHSDGFKLFLKLNKHNTHTLSLWQPPRQSLVCSLELVGSWARSGIITWACQSDLAENRLGRGVHTRRNEWMRIMVNGHPLTFAKGVLLGGPGMEYLRAWPNVFDS